MGLRHREGGASVTILEIVAIFLRYLGMLLFVLCFEILSVCTPRKDGVLETPSFSTVVEVVM